jgi:hypothetical protein
VNDAVSSSKPDIQHDPFMKRTKFLSNIDGLIILEIDSEYGPRFIQNTFLSLAYEVLFLTIPFLAEGVRR